MLAYVFWHRPAEGVEPETYAGLVRRFHRSIAGHPPGGFLRSASFAAPAPNWLGELPAFEDWYVVEDIAALGVLNEAAIGRGHRHRARCRGTRRRARAPARSTGCSRAAPSSRRTRVAVWIETPRGVESPLLAALLGDGMDSEHAGLWQRQLALGPAPEYCVLAAEPPDGVAATRLPHGWSATVTPRTPI